jgi:hypothetical protein
LEDFDCLRSNPPRAEEVEDVEGGLINEKLARSFISLSGLMI